MIFIYILSVDIHRKGLTLYNAVNKLHTSLCAIYPGNFEVSKRPYEHGEKRADPSLGPLSNKWKYLQRWHTALKIATG